MALVVALVPACIDVATEFRCTPGNDQTCSPGGHCEQSGNCSFADPTCGDHNARYDPSAAPGRGGVCVLDATIATQTQPQPIAQQLLFEITTPPQQIIVDSAAPGTDTTIEYHFFAGACPPSSSEQPTTQLACTNQVARSVSIMPGSPGTYCLALIPNAAGHVAVRVFPMIAGSAPGCFQ